MDVKRLFGITEEDLEVYYEDYKLEENILSDKQIEEIINNGFKFVKSLFH